MSIYHTVAAASNPCLTLDMGNVLEEGFAEVWNGSRFRAFRRLIRREQRLPLCHRCPDS